MRLGHFASGRMLYALGQCLIERSSAPDVQRLQSIADAEDRLAHVVGVLQKQLVRLSRKGSADAVSGCRAAPYFSGSTSAGLPGSSTPSQLFTAWAISRRGGASRNHDGLASGIAHRAFILRQGHRYVEWPLRIRYRDGDTWLHELIELPHLRPAERLACAHHTGRR